MLEDTADIPGAMLVSEAMQTLTWVTGIIVTTEPRIAHMQLLSALLAENVVTTSEEVVILVYLRSQ